MARLLLLHHVLGVTDGVRRLAESWRQAGHDVVVPDFFDGSTFDSLEDGLAEAARVGPDAIESMASDAAATLERGFVVCGVSLGAMPAMNLAVDDDGVTAVVVVGSCLPPDALPGPWPGAVPLRILAAKGDDVFQQDGDKEAAEAFVSSNVDAKLKLLPGAEHLFMEASDQASQRATDQLYEFVLRLLTRIDENLPPGATAEEDAQEQVAWDLY